jgi:hypothetical protein
MATIVNISDLYDGFHQIAALAAGLFGLGSETDPPFEEFLDQLELDLFLPACARRARMLSRRSINPEEVADMIRLRESDGTIRPGAAGRYHSHGFDMADDHGDTANQVVAVNLLPRHRSEVELVMLVD